MIPFVSALVGDGKMLTDHERTRALGRWGELKAVKMLRDAKFCNVRDMNEATANHPFGDIYAERNGKRYLLGVKTRNKYQVSGLLNPSYNIKKRGSDVSKLAELHRARLAWVAIQVIRSVRLSGPISAQSRKLKNRESVFRSPCENTTPVSMNVLRKKNSTRVSEWNGPTAATLAAETDGYERHFESWGKNGRPPSDGRMLNVPPTP
jgi:hypothetical protein